MQQPEVFTLRNCDHDDIDEIMLTLARSFNVPVNDMVNVVTMGDLTTLLQQYGNNRQADGCTTQQAFYKVRNALRAQAGNAATIVTPKTPLHVFIAGNNLHKKVEAFKQQLNIDITLLHIKSIPANIISLLGLAAFACCFFSFKFAAILLLACMVFYIISKFFFVELSIKTAGELAQKITEEYYLQARRHTGTINRREIFHLVQNIFSNRLLLDKSVLTRDEVLYQ